MGACKFGAYLTAVSLLSNVIQIFDKSVVCWQDYSICESLFKCLGVTMGLLFLAFYLLCCKYVYPASTSECLQYSFAGRVIWYYATIVSCIIGLSLIVLVVVAICACCKAGEASNIQVDEIKE